jgi:hypothetical protein
MQADSSKRGRTNFKTAALNHSATLPSSIFRRFSSLENAILRGSAQREAANSRPMDSVKSGTDIEPARRQGRQMIFRETANVRHHHARPDDGVQA